MYGEPMTLSRRIEYQTLASLKPHPRNPKTHDVEEIARSISRFGFNDAVIVDERTQQLVSGHGRVEALKLLESRWRPLEGGVLPGGVQLEAGVWCVPVQRGWSSRDDTEAEAFIIAANRLVEKGGYHRDHLEAILRDLSSKQALDGIGYNQEDVARIIASANARTARRLTHEDSMPETAPTRAKLGDVFELGAHRLMCGSSVESADVKKLLAGAKPHLMVTDPPYGVEYDPKWREAVTKPIGPASLGEVKNDGRADWREAWRLFPGDVAYVWHASAFAPIVQASLEAEGFEHRAQIIWVKASIVFSRGHYHWQHEPCLYMVRSGGNGRWAGDRKQSTVWQINGLNPVGSDRRPEDKRTGHSTQKPVECMRRPMVNNSQPADMVYEPFAGSGSTLIAAEDTGRACFAMELHPPHVDLILARWEAFTGKKAVKL